MTASIAIVNRSTVLSDDQVRAALPALQRQISRDFSPIWGLTASLWFSAPDAVPQGAWPMVLYDTADQAGALGYHEDPHGRPDGKVFVKTTMQAKLSWTVTLSHELLEIIPDPTCTRYRSNGLYRYALETCDPVEADRYGYEIDGVQVSDFITPAWFGAARMGAQYDFGHHLTAPRQLLAEGYCLRWDRLRGWRQIVATGGVVQARKAGDFRSRAGTSGRSSVRLAR